MRTPERSKQIRDERQARGVCPVHPAIACAPYKYCELCRTLMRDAKRQQKTDRIAQDKCWACGLVDMANGKRCHECAEIERAAWKIRAAQRKEDK
jgi:hypothetical protein